MHVHRFLSFGMMAVLVLDEAMLSMTLLETHYQPTLENLSQSPNENKNNKKIMMNKRTPLLCKEKHCGKQSVYSLL